MNFGMTSMDQALRENIVHNAWTAFMGLMEQIQYLLDAAEVFIKAHPAGDSYSNQMKHYGLSSMIGTLGTTPVPLAEVIKRWKHDEPRVISAVGVEETLLNEIWCSVDPLVLFLIREKIELFPFNLQEARMAFMKLVHANRTLR